MNVGEDEEKREPFYAVGGNVNWYSHCGKQYRGLSKKLNIELLHDSAILLLGIDPKKKMKMLIQKDTSNPMFTETLFTIAKIWKQFKSPSIDDWIKKLWNIYTRILLSHKKE